jgi:hypothetical protein
MLTSDTLQLAASFVIEAADDFSRRCSVYLLYWYKSTNTDVARLPTTSLAASPSSRKLWLATTASRSRALRQARAQFTSFTGTKVRILTRQGCARRALSLLA